MCWGAWRRPSARARPSGRRHRTPRGCWSRGRPRSPRRWARRPWRSWWRRWPKTRPGSRPNRRICCTISWYCCKPRALPWRRCGDNWSPGRKAWGRERRVAMSFVHLHTHSEYSLLDGANRIPELVSHVKKLGMDSLAVTDHGNLHAAWSFYEQAKTQGIRPILGFEAYLAFGSRREQQKPAWAPSHYSHLVLLAKNRVGYKNLVRLSSIGFTEGFYRRPRIDREVLEAHREGIVCLAACLSGEVALWLRQGRYEDAKQSAEWFARQFGPDGFWLEIQQHGIPDERVV